MDWFIVLPSAIFALAAVYFGLSSFTRIARLTVGSKRMVGRPLMNVFGGGMAYACVNADKPLPIPYKGNLEIPKQIFVGNSDNVSLYLELGVSIEQVATPFQVMDTTTGKAIELWIEPRNGLIQFLEIELMAAGISVDGQNVQRQSLSLLAPSQGRDYPRWSPRISYGWNCHFKNSGDFKVTLILRVVSEEVVATIGTIEHLVKVVRIDHLTQRQVWLLGLVFAAISGGLATAEIIHRLGLF